MTKRRSITMNHSCPSLKLNDTIEPKPVPWLFLETGYVQRKKTHPRKITGQVSLPAKHMTFGSDIMFANTSVGFTNQEMNIINNAEKRQAAEFEIQGDVSRVNLAKQYNAQSKIEFQTLMQRQQEEANLRNKAKLLFKDPEGEELITPRSANTEQSVFLESSRADYENNKVDQNDDDFMEKLQTFDTLQMKNMILDSITPEVKLKGSHFTNSNYTFTKDNQINEKITGGRRNIRRAVSSMADPNEVQVSSQINKFPNPRDMNYQSISRMNKFYEGKY